MLEVCGVKIDQSGQAMRVTPEERRGVEEKSTKELLLRSACCY